MKRFFLSFFKVQSKLLRILNICGFVHKCMNVLGASEVSANLYCYSRTSVLGGLRDYLRLLMGRTLYIGSIHIYMVFLSVMWIRID